MGHEYFIMIGNCIDANRGKKLNRGSQKRLFNFLPRVRFTINTKIQAIFCLLNDIKLTRVG